MKVEIKIGNKLIAKTYCKMNGGDECALIIGKEYEVISESENREEISVKSELFDHHFFSTNSKDDSYWGKFFNLKLLSKSKMKNHQINLTELLVFKSEEKVLFANSTKENKALYLTLYGSFEVWHNGERVFETIQPFNAVEKYNSIMTNLEYINSLPCSQRLKDRIIEICKEAREEEFLQEDFDLHPIDGFFIWDNTLEGFEYWQKIFDSIINNTPIVE